MDYTKQLQAEIQGAHAIFHEFAMLLSRINTSAHFLFFEGDEDPSFYMSFVHPRLNGRETHTFVCNGRTEVLTALRLVEQDGRGLSRSMFFIDKDHTDFCETEELSHDALFQTSTYSIENYVVCSSVLRRYWVERLHLSDTDPRTQEYMKMFEEMHQQFAAKSRVLMAAILLGRGIEGHKQTKLNLNNVQYDKVLKFDYQTRKCNYAANAASYFASSTNLRNVDIKFSELRQICRKYLIDREPKTFIRGKFELWFFWKFLTEITRQLSDRDEAKRNGFKRATPRSQLTQVGCFEFLAPLVPCPTELEEFFNRRLA